MNGGPKTEKKIDVVRSPMTTDDCMNAFRVIRGFAELEDMTSIVISKLIGGNDALTSILLGGVGFSPKKDKLIAICDMYWPDLAVKVRSSFNANFTRGETLRHALAHGSYMGIAENGQYCFLTNKVLAPSDGAILTLFAASRVSSYWKRPLRWNVLWLFTRKSSSFVHCVINGA